MPTITCSFKDFSALLSKKITIEEFKTLLDYAKAELEHVDGDTVSIKFNDTNQPYLWSVEGIALLLRGVIGKEVGIPKLKTKKSDYHILVDQSVNAIRPHITAFIANGPPLTDYALKQLIQLQEKICEHYGQRRQKISIGVYPAQKIHFPLTYKTVAPETTIFIPLGGHEPQNLIQILARHPAGKEYGKVLEKASRWPILIDAHHEILSFIPIINSNTRGALKPGDSHFFFEATGTDERSVNLAATIFAHVLNLRGYTISTTTINKGNKKIVAPNFSSSTIKISSLEIQKLLGLKLREPVIKKLLERARYQYTKGVVTIPPFRQDIMHPHDILEDLAILYGYNNIEASPLTTYTCGTPLAIIPFINTCRKLLMGQGYQEVFSAVLSNKKILHDNMNTHQPLVEIENFTSQTYSAVRTTLVPIILDILSKNKHVDHPHKIFEQGITTQRIDNHLSDHEMLAIATSHATAHFTELRQTFDTFFRSLGAGVGIQETNHPSFIPGRAVELVLNKQSFGVYGEIHPDVLKNFDIDQPVIAGEINLGMLYQILKK